MKIFQRPAVYAFLALTPIVAVARPAHSQEKAPPDKALVVVKLPSSATLVVGSSGTLQIGPERRFVSPSLAKLALGKTYYYTLTATWNENGNKRTETREAVVAAGVRTVVDFSSQQADSPSVQAKKSRTFVFTYSAVVTGLPAGKTARIWLPVAQSTEDQEVEIVSKSLPVEGKIEKEKKFGNQILYVEAMADDKGEVSLKVVYRVKRFEVLGKGSIKVENNDQLAMYLKADAKVPIEGKPLDLIKDKKMPEDDLAAARVLYDVVDGHMRYSKEGTGWGQGDSVWACENGYGNCTDFHSLFISLARSRKIPAKFEIGFPLPEKHGAGDIPGYHCWAKFKPKGQGWMPVDISEAWKNPKMKDYYFGNLTQDRVTFSTGRDLELVPKQDGEPLNFFVYPYVEVDAKPYAADKIQKKFTFEDAK